MKYNNPDTCWLVCWMQNNNDVYFFQALEINEFTGLLFCDVRNTSAPQLVWVWSWTWTHCFIHRCLMPCSNFVHKRTKLSLAGNDPAVLMFLLSLQLFLRRAVSAGAGHRLFSLGFVAESHVSGNHDLLLPGHRVPQAALHQEIHINSDSPSS